MNDNKSAFRSNDYDRKITQILPFYELFYEKVIELVKIFNHNAVKWLDIGCGTGKGRKLVNVIPHRRGKIFFLFPYGIDSKWNIFLYGVLHFHIDYLEKLAALIKAGK